MRVPQVTFKTRVRDEVIPGDNPYRWQDISSRALFDNKKVVLFALPGAFTPTCSLFQLPGYDQLYAQFKSFGVDEIYCLSVNDAFVMNAWAKSESVENVKMLPDGNGEFTRKMGMLVHKDNLGFGMRSWRYAMLVDDGNIQAMWIEPGFEDNSQSDPYVESIPESVLLHVKDILMSK